MKKGFTLVELLAVIVILAIIALIAVPVVLNIINSARESAKLKSAEYYIDAVNQAVVRERMNGIKINTTTCNINSNGYLNCEGIDKEVRIDTEGDMPVSGIIVIENGLVKKNSDTYIVFNDKSIVSFSYDNNSIIKIFESKSFKEDSWETIITNVKAGIISKYNVGDTKEITLTSTDTDIAGTYKVRISNTSTPEDCSQAGFSQTACGFVIEFVDIITTHTMNSTTTNKGGWQYSAMRTYVNNDIYNSLPTTLKNNIIDTTAVSGHGSTSGETNFTTTDKLYLLSTKEVWENGTLSPINYDTARELTRQLDYYKNIGVTTNNAEGAIKPYNGSDYDWWLRSAYSQGTQDFFYVSNDGNWIVNPSDFSVDDTFGVAPAFRIG